ncbi:MAG TPA: tetratricopeptide repeat protein [Anaerolineae bacterium]|nr:tetratricopeptide repeat protein [Anaerolineae bacterium]
MAAPWGTIWLDEEAARRGERSFAITPAGAHTFKGFDQPQTVYTLVERRAPGSQLYRGPLIGREAELARLEAFVQPLRDAQSCGCAGVLVIEGEAGLGKSRLLAEFLQRLTAAPGPVLQCFFCQADQTLREPLNPFRYWLRSYFEQSPGQSEAHNKRAFNRKLDALIAALADQALGAELNRTRSLLGALVDLHWESSLYTQLDPQGRYELTLAALKNLIQAETMRQPVILTLEDAQWLDDVSPVFIARLVRTLAEYPLAVLVTTRPADDAGPVLADVPHERLDLALMSAEGITRLAAELLGNPVAADLAKMVVERSEGNPFFVEQILLYLRETGGIELRDARWRIVGALQDTLLPPDVRAIFTARLDRLTSDVREVVQTAAILGREFEIRALLQMLREDETLRQKITTAEEAAIWAALNQARYIFKHALLRDAAYKMQLRARRSRLHHLAARALETLYADNLAPHYGKLAHHYEAAYQQGIAEARDSALDYLQLAAQQAAEVYENAAAVDYYSRALALAPTTEPERCFTLRLAREELCHLQGARELQAQDLATLADLSATFHEAGRQAVVAARQARYALAAGDYPQAIAAAQQTIASAQAAHDPANEVAGYVWWASAVDRAGDEDAACAQYTQALALARAVGDRRGEGDALRGLGIMSWRQSRQPEAQTYYQQSLTLSQELGDRRGEAATRNNLGLVLSEMGEYAQAQAQYAAALAIRREIGDRAGEGSTLNNLGLLRQTLGSFAEARESLQQSLAIWRDIGSRPGEAVTLDNLGFVTLRLGEYDAAQRYLSAALTLERTLGARKAEGWTLNNLGRLALAVGDYAQAEAYFQEALALRRAANHAHYVVEDLAGLAQVALARGDLPHALARIEEAWPILETNPTLEGAEHPQQALVACYQVLRAADDARAAPLLAALHTRLQERAAKITDADLRRAFLENVPEHRELMRQAAGHPAEAAPPLPEPPAAPSPKSPAAPPPDAPASPLPPAPESPSIASPPPRPRSLRIPLEGSEGAPSVVIVIENLTINVHGGAGIVVGDELAEVLRQFLEPSCKLPTDQVNEAPRSALWDQGDGAASHDLVSPENGRGAGE